MASTNHKFLERIGVYIIFLGFLLPLWCHDYPVSQDGPAHIHSAFVAKQLLAGGNALLEQRIQFNFSLVPNLVGTLVMVPLNYLFSPVVAGKIFISLYLLLFPVSAAFAVRSFKRDLSPSALLIIAPLIFNYIYHMGFYNYLLGVVSVLFFIGLWERSKRSFNIICLTVMLLASLTVYCCHLVAAISIGIYIVVDILLEWFLLRDTRLFVRRIMSSLLVTLPATLMAIPYIYHYIPWLSGPSNSKSFLESMRGMARDIVWALPRLFVSFSIYDYILIGLTLALFILLTVIAIRHRLIQLRATKPDILLILFLLFLFMYFYASEAHFLKSRLLLYAATFFALWLMVNLPQDKLRYFVACTVISLIFVGYEWNSTAKANVFYHKMVSVSEPIKKGESFVAIRLLGDEYQAHRAYRRAEPELHAPSYVAIRDNIFDWHNYQFGRTEFILRYKVDTPAQHYQGLEGQTELSADELKTMLKIVDVDYLLLFSNSTEPISSFITQDEADKMVGLSFVKSSPDGSIVLYRTPMSPQPKG